MGLRQWIKPRLQDLLMRQMDSMRVDTTRQAEGDVLEIGFGTGLNLQYYGPAVKSLVGLDPMDVADMDTVQRRIAQTRFPIERQKMRADTGLPFDSGRFDSVVTTWTLCSIPDVNRALGEMRRVLKPGGTYLFLEHGRSPKERTAQWQDRINPIWRCVCDGCNINREIDKDVQAAGFDLTSLARFRADGPEIASSMYRGVATRS